MIAYVDIEVHAENPQMPIGPCVAFVGSPSNVRILKVPKGIGSWRIDAVAVAFTRPDNSITTVSAVNVAGCWVATLPASDVSGRCDKGFQIEASGIDENGNAVTGYVLGVGDVVILPRDGTAVSDGVQYYFHYRDAVPATPRKGDTCLIDGTLKWYDGTAWQVFAAGADIDVVPPSTNPADEGKAADAKATGDALAGKRDKDDLALYRKVGVGETWTLVGEGGITTTVTGVFMENAGWGFYLDGENVAGTSSGAGADDYAVSWSGSPEVGNGGTATRPFAYQPVAGDALAKTSQLPAASDATPQMDGTASAGSSAAFARGDHVHPKDTTKQDAIADLAAIRSGAAAGATAVQPAALRYDLPASATAISSASGRSWSLPSSAFPVVYNDGVEDVTLAESDARYAEDDDYLTFSTPDGTVIAGFNKATGAFEYAFLSATYDGSSTPPNLVIVDYGEATLADRTSNRVAITAAIAELRLTFPAAVSGKVRDFGLRVEVGTGSAALTAPALVPVASTGETVTLENPDAAIPVLADGAADAKGVTLLYFSETAPGKFLVKGEEVKEVA